MNQRIETGFPGIRKSGPAGPSLKYLASGERIVFAAAVVMLAAIAFAHSGEPAADVPPGKDYSAVIIQEPMPGEDKAINNSTLNIMAGERIVTSEPTSGYLLDEFWSSDGRYVALNNRQGNSGDYLWIFSLPDGRCIKRPTDKMGSEWEMAALAKIRETTPEAKDAQIDRAWLTADGWIPSGELIFRVRARYAGTGSLNCMGLAEIKEGKPVLKSLAMEKPED